MSVSQNCAPAWWHPQLVASQTGCWELPSVHEPLKLHAPWEEGGAGAGVRGVSLDRRLRRHSLEPMPSPDAHSSRVSSTPRQTSAVAMACLLEGCSSPMLPAPA